MKIMASDPITSWQIDGETMETVTNFIYFNLRLITLQYCIGFAFMVAITICSDFGAPKK